MKSRDILLSIKRPDSRLILDGKKTIELRKSHPRHLGNNVYLYESGNDGEKMIIGKCYSRYYTQISDELCHNLNVFDVINRACVSMSDIIAYKPFYGWLVDRPKKIQSVALSEIGLTRPPKSWQYLTDEQVDLIEKLGKDGE